MSDINAQLRKLRDGLARSAAIKAWCLTTYSRIHRVAVGEDPELPYTDEIYPIVMLWDVNKQNGLETDRLPNVFGVACGIKREHASGYPETLPGLSEGTNAATIKTTVACTYNIAGVQASKTVTDNIAMTACAQQAISTWCFYLVSINAAGAVTITKGTDAASADAAEVPALPAASAAVGTILVQTDGTHTFTSGTTDLSATGITATIQDWNIIELTGVQECESFRKLVLADIDTIVEGFAGCRIDDVETDYATEYPFFVAGMKVTISQETEFGDDAFA